MLLEKISKGLHLTVGLPSFSLFCIYILVVCCSSFWQRISKPFNLKICLILHNFICCLASVVTLLAFCYGLYKSDYVYQLHASPTLKSTFWLYWVTKNIELLDTVFMILRHRSRQISVLHVYHHSTMLILSDLAYRWYPWPSIAMFLAINSFVHVILYFYYGISALRPSSPPNWKKLLTEIQILQFLIDFVLAAYGYVYHGFCIYGIVYGIIMTSLFSNFYYHAYIKNMKKNVN